MLVLGYVRVSIITEHGQMETDCVYSEAAKTELGRASYPKAGPRKRKSEKQRRYQSIKRIKRIVRWDSWETLVWRKGRHGEPAWRYGSVVNNATMKEQLVDTENMVTRGKEG